MVLISAFLTLSVTITEVLSVQVCGYDLANLLDLVCDGRGFHFKTEIPTINRRTAVQYLQTTIPVPAPQRDQRSHGVVSECCHKPCKLGTLESYCASPTERTTTGTVPPEVSRELLNTPSPPPYIFSRTTPQPTTQRPSPRYRYGSNFFFVRPVGPRPTRTPVVTS